MSGCNLGLAIEHSLVVGMVLFPASTQTGKIQREYPRKRRCKLKYLACILKK